MYKYNKKRFYIDKIINTRFSLFLFLIIVLFTILFFKISSVMLVQNKKYKKELSKLSYSEVYGTSTPRGRIYDRNYNIIVDNKSVKTIIYKKRKGTSDAEMIRVAGIVSSHLDLDYSKLTDRSKREYYCAKNRDICNKGKRKS